VFSKYGYADHLLRIGASKILKVLGKRARQTKDASPFPNVPQDFLQMTMNTIDTAGEFSFDS
jgi:hypothetical protein